MAAAGPVKAITTLSSDPYVCRICCKNMLERRPRLLSCHHSYCSFCLSSIQDMHTIRCPQCGEFTFLLNGDVRQLPIHTLLLRMKRREDELRAMPYSVCSLCQREKPDNKCVECRQMLCQACTHTHDQQQSFADHLILKLCITHWEGLTQMCKSCTAAVCAKCIIVDHPDHELVDLASGARLLRNNLDSLRDDMNKHVKQLEGAIAREQAHIQPTQDMKTELLKRRMKLLEKLVKIDDTLSEIEGNYEKRGNKILETMSRSKQDLQDAAARLETDNVEKDIQLISRYVEIERDAKQVIADGQKAETLEYQEPPFILADPDSDDVVISVAAKDKTVEEDVIEVVVEKSGMGELGEEGFQQPVNLTLLFELKESGGVGFKQPTEVSLLGKDALVADSSLRCAVRLDPSGRLVSKYYPANEEGDVCGVSVHNHHVYILQNNLITKIPESDPDSPDKTCYSPGVDMQGNLLVVDESKFIITDGKSKVYEYYVQDNKTKVVLDDLRNPTYISMTPGEEERRFVVTVQGEHRLHVYDAEWQLLSIIGGLESGGSYLLSPQATVVTAHGNILVPNHQNSNIRGFDLEGHFLGQIRMEDRAIEWPKGMAYRHPHLWITENHMFHAAVKCFLVPDSVNL